MAASSHITSTALGPFVRLWGIKASELPQPSSPPDEITPFVISILEEAVPFIYSIPSPADDKDISPTLITGPWKAKGAYPYPGSTAQVEAYERTISTTELKEIASQNHIVPEKSRDFHSEFWTCRRSVHEDVAKKGTANWTEFVQCFRDHHAEAEKSFTASIVDRNTAAEWNCMGIAADIADKTWSSVSMKLEESRHHIGALLKDRVFAVLQLTATVAGEQEFIVVSIVVTESEVSPLCRVSSSSGVVLGAYTSVERIRKLPTGNIEWTMATSSDARGVLPAWLQALSVPGKIRQDVPLFLVWLAKQKRRQIQQGIIPQ